MKFMMMEDKEDSLKNSGEQPTRKI